MESSKFGEYRIIAVIGHGGMAEVFLSVRADQLQAGIEKLVVIKKMREDYVNDKEFVTMFLDEARIAARLNHPNIVQTYEAGNIGGTYYLTMEYLDGQPLHRVLHRLKAAGKSNKALICTVLIEVLGALEYAHRLTDFSGSPLGLVHRDVTPQNVFLTYDGNVKLVDFGIAKAAGRSTETRMGMVKGKVAYMAPEQAMAQPVDGRADVFAVGAMLFEAACGQRLWPKSDEKAILVELITGKVPSSPKKIDPSVPDELDAICRKALAVARDDRYGDAGDMHRALTTFASAHGLLLTRRQLGDMVAAEFTGKRAQLGKIIEDRLAYFNADRRTGTEELPIATSSLPQLSMSGSSMISSAGKMPGSGSTGTGQRSELPPVSLTPRGQSMPTPKPQIVKVSASPGHAAPGVGWYRLALLAACVVLAVAVTVVIALATTSSSTTASAEATPRAPAEERIHLVVRGRPAQARFRIDDGRLLENPYVVDVPKDAEKHVISAQAPGYKDRIHEVRFDRDVTVDLFLEPAAPRPTAPDGASLSTGSD